MMSPTTIATAVILMVSPASAWTCGGGIRLSARTHAVRLVHEPLLAMVTASGLEYEETTAGTGASPSTASSVTVHYTGKLKSDGRVFDSSYSRGEPTTFKVNQVIQGWQEGLALMKEGGKATLTIPAALAYGSKQMNDIPPNSDLVFEVELLKVAEELIPQGYLERSFQSAGMKRSDPDASKDKAEDYIANPLGLAAIAAIGLASYFHII